MLSQVISVFYSITLPIILLICFGWVGQRLLRTDVSSLNRFVLYLLLPPLLLNAFGGASLDLNLLLQLSTVSGTQTIALAIIGYLLAFSLRVPPHTRAVVALAIAFPNSVNFGLPLVELSIGPQAITAQAVNGAIHSLFIVSVGLTMLALGGGPKRPDPMNGADLDGGLDFSASARGTPMGAVATGVARSLINPVIVAVLLGLGMRIYGVSLPSALSVPMGWIAEAFAPVALIVLGAQIAVARWVRAPLALIVGCVGTLVFAPALTIAGLWLNDFQGYMALDDQTRLLAFINGALPTGALLALLGAEYGRDRDLPAMIVLMSTLLSPLTLTFGLTVVRQQGLLG
jgi:predicted permease